MQTFEQYLMEQHCKDNPQLLDDMLVDDFNDWLERIGFDGILESGKSYGKEIRKIVINDLIKMAKQNNKPDLQSFVEFYASCID